MLKRIILVVLFTGIINFAFSEIDPSDPTDGGTIDCPGPGWTGPDVYVLTLGPDCELRVRYCHTLNGYYGPEIYIRDFEIIGSCLTVNFTANGFPAFDWPEIYTLIIEEEFGSAQVFNDVPVCGEGTHGEGVEWRYVAKHAGCFESGTEYVNLGLGPVLVQYWRVCDTYENQELKCYQWYSLCYEWEGEWILKTELGPEEEGDYNCINGCDKFCD